MITSISRDPKKALRGRLCSSSHDKIISGRSLQQLKKAACLTVSEGTAAEAGTCAGTSEETIVSTSAADEFLTERLYEENIENVEEMETIEEIVQEGDFYTGEDQLNTTDENEEINWVVEKAEPQQPKEPISEEIDFADFAYIFEEIKNLANHSSIGCGIEHFEIIGCQQYGLKKTYNVQCRMCNYIGHIPCLRKNDGTMDINHAAVSATIVTGGEYNQLEELLSGVNMSCMTKGMYEKCQDDIIDGFEGAA
uniref:uncharacterized protein LOC117610934 n=1 Tax=Osmia lignaria TaxID=473952 RepID=UPI001478DD2A|nr:uncharacterized protein LOC117610934 [Osmia lignaria]